MLQETQDNLRVSLRETEANLTWDQLPAVLADHTQLLQLFQNLIANAIKFRSADSPRVHVSATRSNGHCEFSVLDNGIGIEPQYGERIFEIFQRLHEREQYPGSGVGLAICKKIVERHRGSIWMEPGRENGSVFRFTIPVAASPVEETS